MKNIFIRLNLDQQNLLQWHANRLVVEDEYFFLPYWFRAMKPEENPAMAHHEYFEMLHLENLPLHLREAINKQRGTVDPLITKEFLISKGYIEVNPDRNYQLKRGDREQNITIQFETWGDPHTIVICGDDNPYDFTMYNGPIPTESQYEVLNQLLKLHA